MAAPRPIWSVMIPTYNCASYLRKTLDSVLRQDLGPAKMQIEVIDDHSTKDDPQSVVREFGQNRVTFYQQPRNVGYIKNFETCLIRSKGQLIHLLHGDDCVRDNFYLKMQAAFEQHPQVGAAFCRSIYMDDEGHWLSLSPLEDRQSCILKNWLETIASGQRITTPSVVVRREVYEQLGGFDRRFSCAGEDWEMWVRIAAHYPVWFETEPLALYRVRRAGSLTGGSTDQGEMIQDMRLATEIIASYLAQYLPAQTANAVLTKARHTYAWWAIDIANELYNSGKLKLAIKQSQNACKCAISAKILLTIFGLFWQKAIFKRRKL